MVFLSRILGQRHIFLRVELTDGNIFGVYINRAYPQQTINDQMFADPQAFAYWLNENKIYPAELNSKSQFDVSADYLISIGNTYNWDGFWFQQDFNKINSNCNHPNIISGQFKDLKIPLKVRTVKVFKMYQL